MMASAPNSAVTTSTSFLQISNNSSRRRPRSIDSGLQHWIAEVLPVCGQITIDGGAEESIVEHGASLLPIGVTAVEGMFDKGECVEIMGASGVIARGLCNYHAEEIRKMMGIVSDRIEEVLGFHDFSSIVHRDNLVLVRS